MQVGFGEWQSDCVPGTKICTIVIDPHPSSYYGGPQFYPDEFISETNFNPLGYGNYETYDGLSLLGYSVPASGRRAPAGAFNEPLPQPLTVLTFTAYDCDNPGTFYLYPGDFDQYNGTTVPGGYEYIYNVYAKSCH